MFGLNRHALGLFEKLLESDLGVFAITGVRKRRSKKMRKRRRRMRGWRRKGHKLKHEGMEKESYEKGVKHNKMVKNLGHIKREVMDISTYIARNTRHIRMIRVGKGILEE